MTAGGALGLIPSRSIRLRSLVGDSTDLCGCAGRVGADRHIDRYTIDRGQSAVFLAHEVLFRVVWWVGVWAAASTAEGLGLSVGGVVRDGRDAPPASWDRRSPAGRSGGRLGDREKVALDVV